jgi:hypothetical protein
MTARKKKSSSRAELMALLRKIYRENGPVAGAGTALGLWRVALDVFAMASDEEIDRWGNMRDRYLMREIARTITGRR